MVLVFADDKSVLYKASLLAPLVLAVLAHKAFLFEFFVALNVVQNLLGFWNWFNLVDDNLYVGAVLLMPGDPIIVSKKLGVNAILCTLEDSELKLNSLFGASVPPEEWRRLGVEFNHLPISDYAIVAHEQLARGASFINLHVSDNRRVYVYCRSGCSRAACMVLAYFIKHRGMSAKAAYEKLKRKRRINFGWGSAQAKNLQAFEASIRGSAAAK